MFTFFTFYFLNGKSRKVHVFVYKIVKRCYILQLLNYFLSGNKDLTSIIIDLGETNLNYCQNRVDSEIIKLMYPTFRIIFVTALRSFDYFDLPLIT